MSYLLYHNFILKPVGAYCFYVMKKCWKWDWEQVVECIPIFFTYKLVFLLMRFRMRAIFWNTALAYNKDSQYRYVNSIYFYFYYYYLFAVGPRACR